MIDMLKAISKKSWAMLALVALAQMLALVWMIAGRISLINSSRTVILETVPIDPRSLFRGDYVSLGYKISDIGGSYIKQGEKFIRNDVGYVRMRPREKRPAELIGLTNNIPSDLTPGDVVIRGRIVGTWLDKDKKQRVRLRYGLNRYYVPEGEGKRLERMVGKNNFAVLVAVADNGKAAIKGLMINGKLQYEEPLF